MAEQSNRHPTCQFRTEKSWLDRQYHQSKLIKKPNELEKTMQNPPEEVNSNILDRIQGSMIGMALGDALGAFVEFRPHQFLVDNPVNDLQGGGTWGLEKGQFTDDTSMALCLANSLIARQDFVPYDQLVRYKWWYKDGYMSSTGKCFDIGSATKQSLEEFERRQNGFAKKYQISSKQIDYLSDPGLLREFNVYCSQEGVAGNGALMRLAPVPLFFQKHPREAIAFSGFSGVISHGDRIAFDACRYYGALIVAAVHGLSKTELLDKGFYLKYQGLFNNITIHPEIMKIAQGSYKKGGYDEGIRGKGYIVNALEAALWAFWSEESFEKGALAAVNLGDDTDTTAAIYGQLAGAHYGYKNLPKKWLENLYARSFIECVSKWIVYEGQKWQPGGTCISTIPPLTSQSQSNAASYSSSNQKETLTTHPTHIQTFSSPSKAEKFSENWSTTNQKHKSAPHVPDPTKSSTEPYAKLKSTSESAQVNQTNTTGTSLYNTAAPGASGIERDSHHHSSLHWYSMYSSKPLHLAESLQSCDDVSLWLRKLNVAYGDYVDAFKADFVDGFWLLNYIDDQKLQKYGVKNEVHRRDILKKIQDLKGYPTTRF